MNLSEAVKVLRYEGIIATLERRERESGLPVGSWKTMEASVWDARVKMGPSAPQTETTT